MGHHRISRTVALALTLVALGAPIAAAQQDLRSPDSRDAAASARAHERFETSYGDPTASAALAQQRYLTSYGAPEPLSRPQSPVAPDDTPWIALSIAAAVAIVAASVTQLRRARIRRRRPARSTA